MKESAMRSNGQSKDVDVMPTVMITFSVIALVVSALTFGFLFHKSTPTAVTVSSGGATAAPAIDASASPPDGFRARDPKAPPPGTARPGTVTTVTLHDKENKVENDS